MYESNQPMNEKLQELMDRLILAGLGITALAVAFLALGGT
jgi:hypothetical protein